MYEMNEKSLLLFERNILRDSVSGFLYLENANIEIDDSNIKEGTLSIDNQCINGEELEFGSVYAGQLTFQIKTEISRYSLFGAEIRIEYNYYDKNDTRQNIPMGVYYVTEATREGQYIKIVALDAMSKMDGEFDGVAIMGTPFEILSYICEKCGLELENTEEEIAAMPNGTRIFQIDENSGCSTWRDCLVILSQILGGFATATRHGDIKICQFMKEPCYKLPPDKSESTDVADYDCQYSGLKATLDCEEYISGKSSADSLVMAIDDNPLFYTGIEKDSQNMTNEIFGELSKIIYTPSSVSTVGFPFLECGDMVTIEVNGAEYNSLLTSYVWNYRGKCTYTAAGKNPKLNGVKDKQTKDRERQEKASETAKIVFLKATNASDLEITSEAKEILRFSVTSIKNTNIIFLAQLLVDVETETEAEVITGKYTDAEGNEQEISITTSKEKKCNVNFSYFITKKLVENYNPVEQLTAGKHMINLFFVLPDMESNTTERFTVEMTCDSGTIKIDAENINAVIIGQGLNTSVEKWDGTFDLQEYIPKFGFIPPEFSFKKLHAIVESKIITPIKNEFTDTVSKFTFTPHTFEIHSLSENITSGFVVTQAVISNEGATKLQYNEKYVQVVGGVYKRIEKWEYNSNIVEIDIGTLAELEINTDNITVLDCEVSEK